ncbi:adenosine deaminase [Photobacterium alginatilyticum]|uniref:Adenine deaminase n=1 Tax=Photobacterium alginatilyticum TaxID=1775171 RepID=A0ABW9YQT3_9GAMM|nr:adenosine deaminase [Photobacterium alginatilyticum]NBI55922.1 adenosine deaminase [Photobacterium alginatilyticum]
MEGFIRALPKIELHLHIEGTLEPEMMLELAKRNQVSIPYQTITDVHAAYAFSDLSAFYALYGLGVSVLKTEQDFYDLTWAYLKRCKEEHVLHTEISFDPQLHTRRGVEFGAVVNGICRALQEGCSTLEITSRLIMCFQRDLSQEEALETLQQTMPYKDSIIAVGLDSSEVGNPPEKFAQVFEKARQAGFLTVAHAGEDGPVDNIWHVLGKLQVARIDHGVRCTDDEKLVEHLVAAQIPLTVCPLSNVRLGVFAAMDEHNIADLLERGVCVTINSDDPAFFGGYMVDNFMAVANAFKLSKKDMARFSSNAIEASFLTSDEKEALHARLQHYLDLNFRPII